MIVCTVDDFSSLWRWLVVLRSSSRVGVTTIATIVGGGLCVRCAGMRCCAAAKKCAERKHGGGGGGEECYIFFTSSGAGCALCNRKGGE